MITDSIISWFQQIISYIVDSLPDAAIIATGQGASSGTSCCAAFLIDSLSAPVSAIVSGGMSGLANSPVSILIDWGRLGFVLGCMLAFLIAFIVIKILIQFWMLVKW